MNRKLLTVLFLVSLGIIVANGQNLLPRPTKAAFHKGTFRLTGQTTVKHEGKAPDATILFKDAVKATPSENAKVGKGGNSVVLIKPLQNCGSPETYRLRITHDSIIAEVASKEALTRCAATLIQLRLDTDFLPCCDIEDSPTYSWRGIMLDVSRHFFSLDYLKKQIDVMAQFKLNKLHLHLTDAAGWRMEIKRYPRLTSMAAWRTDALWKDWWKGERAYMNEGEAGAYGGYYTQEELRQLVSYAKERGIDIVPEIEMPGHSEEVLAAYPELSCTHTPLKAADFCPGNIGTYDFLENVLLEVMEVFPSKYIHVGGDEAGKADWNDCPLCQKKTKELGLEKVQQLQGHLIRHMNEFLQRHDRILVGWDEILADTLTAGTHIMNWRATSYAREAIEKGLKVILTPSAYCYFDYYQDAPPFEPEAIGGYIPLEKAYQSVSLEELTMDERKAVIGIQGNLWAEYIPTEAHAEYMLYPRALAIAEIGWNGEKRPTYEAFKTSVVCATAQLKKNGINCFDISKEKGLRPESLKPVKHKAVGKPVEYLLPYSQYYPAQNEVTLTDGLLGGWTYSDQRWQGFIRGERFDVVIDLLTQQTIREVSTGFIEANGAEVFLPGSYEIFISTDGKTYQKICDQTFTYERNERKACQTYTWKGRQKARYVRVKARPLKFGGWIFADEVIIR